MDDKRVADYFIISGVPDDPTVGTESKPLINSALPITDIAVIFRRLGEECPEGFTCIDTTPDGHLADLNHGNFSSPNIQICYRRGTDKPPLVDVGVWYEGKEQVMPDVEVVYNTPTGLSASTSSSKNGTYLTYRRAKSKNALNQLVVVDLCVILNNKSESPPYAFYAIKKNLNKSYYGMIGSEVYLCYKKTVLTPPSISYKPEIISRFPLQDYANFPLPDTVPLFCLPVGANIEMRQVNSRLPRPTSNTFVLTSDSAQKIYGSSLSFYEPFDYSSLTDDQKIRLGIPKIKNQEGESKQPESEVQEYDTFVVKSICILSRWPFFECFEKFLSFLHKLVFNVNYSNNINSILPAHMKPVPLEHHISHFLLDVSFPSPQRPTVMVQLMAGTDETLSICQPSSRLPLPLTGASFMRLLTFLGVDNTMNVLLFALCEQKILLHSLKLWLLTGIAEAISAMLFPFHWQCPYVPLCPLSLHGILNAPLPFIVGIDSRCFDTFTPPQDIISINLDTQSIHAPETKKCLNLRILPKRAARVLRASLEKLSYKCARYQAQLSNQSPQNRSASCDQEKKIELEIQEAFVRFMATILRGFRSYLLPITKAPTVGATDPTSLFDFEGFLMSRDRNYTQFYQHITKTQMFTHYIEERSFVSDKNTSLAFFDDCEEKLSSSDHIFSNRPIKLFDKEDGLVRTDRSVYIPAPEPSIVANSTNSLDEDRVKDLRNIKFGPLNATLFHRHAPNTKVDKSFKDPTFFEYNLTSDGHNPDEFNSSFSISRRTKQEIKSSQRLAKKSADTPLDWSKYLVSCCHSLWFSTLPSYLSYCKSMNLQDPSPSSSEQEIKLTARILRYAYSTIVRMQKHQLTTDEICFRVLTLLCGYHGQPALAVRVFFEMKKAGIKPNAVTYGYYNRAVLESKWPDNSKKPTTILWTKIRNVISGISLFKFHGRVRMERRNLSSIQFMGDPSFHRPEVDMISKPLGYNQNNNLFKPTTLPANTDFDDNVDRTRSYHRGSLINRSFSSQQRSSNENLEDSRNMDVPVRNTNLIHKSFSMHLGRASPERGSLVRADSTSLDEVLEPQVTQRAISSSDASNYRKTTSNLDLFSYLRHKCSIFTDDPASKCFNDLDLIDNSSGLLFTTNPKSIEASRIRLLSSSENLDEKNNKLVSVTCQTKDFLRAATIPSSNQITDANEFLKANSFGEDTQIIRMLEPREQKLNRSESNCSLVEENASSDNSKSDCLSESTQDESEDISIPEDEEEEDSGLLKNITSTPNFKLSTLINDASSIQWSKWTSAQNSKSVYKGIRSAATGLVSSFQEIKSSFSSNNNTPAKPIAMSMLNQKSATREILSQFANSVYNTIQSTRGYDDVDDGEDVDDQDGMSIKSQDLLSNDEDVEDELNHSNQLFVALEKHYNNTNSMENLLNHMTSLGADEKHNQVALVIKLTTCSRCNICKSLLFDEEIMQRWSHNESNLNTKCIYCRAKIVPLMSIFIEDYRFSTNDAATRKDSGDCNLLDLDFDTDSSAGDDKTSDIKTQTNVKSNPSEQITKAVGNHQQNFTVPYLSPIVLRKELESVFESSGDSCPASSNFIDEHPIIYWNLLWYFSRINVPTHLALLYLNSPSILAGRTVGQEWIDCKNVLVKTLWDNEKLHSGIGKPLYKQLTRGDPSIRVKGLLSDDIYFTRSGLDKVISFIRANELTKAMNMVLNARLKSSYNYSFDKNRHNLYRDLIFLMLKEVGTSKLNIDNFEKEYKRAFGVLNFEQVALNRFDRPPTIGSIFCRKSFKELSLCD